MSECPRHSQLRGPSSFKFKGRRFGAEPFGGKPSKDCCQHALHRHHVFDYLLHSLPTSLKFHLSMTKSLVIATMFTAHPRDMIPILVLSLFSILVLASSCIMHPHHSSVSACYSLHVLLELSCCLNDLLELSCCLNDLLELSCCLHALLELSCCLHALLELSCCLHDLLELSCCLHALLELSCCLHDLLELSCSSSCFLLHLLIIVFAHRSQSSPPFLSSLRPQAVGLLSSELLLCPQLDLNHNCFIKL